ncbi:SDR family oxidoreductase [Microbacterium kyungheense]|uniref:Uncharacterized protein YbjT (DUF2867 family) n=1 Tax=Microbacterium kyungheense TaxID=1263636 RepID=A0A543ES21_9MICO|nr:NmrA family transcriptional regulator [Microbacterium kyungheense]TQM24384.1 uncharacterized protein YbjT (DUF2867 family) [Microbacterium kyungheense]
MRVVVIGGTGQIGGKVTALLRAAGHEAVPASPSTGVDAATGRGLAAALHGADTVIDVSKPHGYDPAAVEEFFRAAATNLVAAERAAGVRHHLALAAVGTEAARIPFYRAKATGTELIRSGGVPYTLVHATQFFEFVFAIADSATVDGEVRLPAALVQPVAGADVARRLVELASALPLDGAIDVAGPDVLPLADFVRRALAATGDPRTAHIDADALYFGGRIDRTTLLPAADAQLLPTRFDDWLVQHTG